LRGRQGINGCALAAPWHLVLLAKMTVLVQVCMCAEFLHVSAKVSFKFAAMGLSIEISHCCAESCLNVFFCLLALI
jgi:hypothetical protein